MKIKNYNKLSKIKFNTKEMNNWNKKIRIQIRKQKLIQNYKKKMKMKNKKIKNKTIKKIFFKMIYIKC